MDIYGDEYQQCQDFAKKFEESEIGKHYKDNFCLKETGRTVSPSVVNAAYNNIKPYITNSLEEVQSKVRKKLCVLPKDHVGRCSCFPKVFIQSALTKKIDGKTDTSIFSTPGADDYVFKNRATRLFPIALTNKQERSIRQPQGNKLKCAIPLKEQTTPFMMATALIDWMVYTMNVDKMSEFINYNSETYKCYHTNNSMINHKNFLIYYFNTYNRTVFNEHGNTICPIIHKELEISNVADITRDNRTIIDKYDIQMGHISSRCNECYTIYGTNLVMMTREGNRIIGEYSFIEEEWLNVLRTILSQFPLPC